MKFSIIVPVYNAENWIARCLDSIQAQTFCEFEVIIIDDGSTDNSQNIIQRYCETDSRFKYFYFENSGVGITRSRGISLSSGDYLLFVDSDDSINPKLLESIVPYTMDNSIDLIRFQCLLVNDSPTKDSERYNFKTTDAVMSGMEALKLWSVPGKKYAVFWLFCTKRKLFYDSMYVPDLHCYEDVAILPLVIASCSKVVTIDYVGYNYILRSTSLTNTVSIESERSRAKDFFTAYDFAVHHFLRLPNITSKDIAFFISDYNKRLTGKYNSLPDKLKDEFAQKLANRIR